jgi:mono/diheme cytochrome c family protein
MLALSNVAGVALLILGAIFVLAAAGGLALRSRVRGQTKEIPNAMRPGPADAALETPLLTKLQGWGVVLVAFFVVWIPLNWIREPSENLRQERELEQLAFDRGQHAVQLYSEENQLGIGCVRCHGPELRGGVIVNGVNPDGSTAYAIPPNLTTVCGGPFGNPPHPAIFSQEDIYQVIREGRNAMPSWSIRFKGALDDQQINDLVVYLIEISSENVPFEDNVCLNPDASTRALEQNAALPSTSQLNPRDP